MTPTGHHLIVHLEFESVVGEVSRAIRDEGLQVIGRIDVRDRIRQDLRREFHQYVLLDAWAADLAYDALLEHPDAGADLLTTFAIYELAASKTVVVATGRASAAISPERRRESPTLAVIADQENMRIECVLDRVRRAAGHTAGMAA